VLATLLAAASALVWGTSDYSGGRVTRRHDSLRVTIATKLLSLPALAGYLLLVRGATNPASLAWGAGAGLCGLIALVAFYRGLAKGAMAVVAPVSAVTAAVLPLVFGLLTEASPGRLPLIGALCALFAIALVSLAPTDAPVRITPGLLGLALGSGAGFGLFFVLLHQADLAAGGNGGLWPILAAQLGALGLGAVLLLAGRAGRPGIGAVFRDRAVLRWAVIAGVFDMTANVLYLVAVRHGAISIVGPLASLYPVTTVLLALVLDRERVRPVQVAGLGLAVAALMLVAV
jgi:drug/metabolite transporter (DMT)-like permease